MITLCLQKISLRLCVKIGSGLKESKSDQGANSLEAVGVIHTADDGTLGLGVTGGNGERD